MNWLSVNNLRLYSSYPPFLLPLVGDSVHHRPKFDATQTKGMAGIAETVWLLQNIGDTENVRALDEDYLKYSSDLSSLTNYVRNLHSNSFIDTARFNELADATVKSFTDLSVLETLKVRLSEFIAEAKYFVHVVKTSEPENIREYINTCKHLFKGACGVRHVDFIAYKDK